MRQALGQQVRLGQELKLNPRLYQAMDMLTMPLLELQQHLKQELETNPFLELVEEEDDDPAATDEERADAGEGDAEGEGEGEIEPGEPLAEPLSTVEGPDEPRATEETDWEAFLNDDFEGSTPTGTSEGPSDEWEPATVAVGNLLDHLRDQLNLLDLAPRDRFLAEELVGHLSDDGFLGTALPEVVVSASEELRRLAEASGRDPDAVPAFTLADGERVLTVLQGLEPSGVAARDLRECLLLQLRDLGQDGSLAARMVREHFDDLAAHRWVEIARRTGTTPTEVQAAADAVARLNPKPGRLVAGGSDEYVIPDLVVEKVEGRYLVFLNDGNVPRLRLSRSYTDIARDKRKFEGENREFITSRLNAAQWLVQAIEQRRHTMLKVMHYIVDRQRDFFEKGVQGLKPLTLREVADAIGMHESTISRVTSEKYAQTPRGVLPLKFFFSSGLQTDSGEDASARAIKDAIGKLVSGEDPRNPLTDQEIVERLGAGGVRIARRTVAKYRDQLGVLSARMRKRV